MSKELDIFDELNAVQLHALRRAIQECPKAGQRQIGLARVIANVIEGHAADLRAQLEKQIVKNMNGPALGDFSVTLRCRFESLVSKAVAECGLVDNSNPF